MAHTLRILLLHPEDNVLVVTTPLSSGDVIEIDGRAVQISQNVAVGHKIARFDLESGAKILRYGAPIGSLVMAAKTGEHIHNHNLMSDYIPSHNRLATKLEG